MSLNLSVPKIAITPEAEEDDDNNFLNLSEALTDIEELYDDTVSERRHSYRKKLKIKVTDTDGYNTALEDIEASDDEDNVLITQHSSPIILDSFDMEKYSTEENIGLAEKNTFSYQYLHMQPSVTNMVKCSEKKNLNNMIAVTDAEDYDTENEIEENDNIFDEDFDLDSYDSIQATEISDNVQLRKNDFIGVSSPSPAADYKPKKKPPTFSQIMKAKAKSANIKIRRKKKCRVLASKSNDSSKTEGSDSSDMEVTQPKGRRNIISMNSLNYESEIEEDVQLPFPVCKKMFTKTKNLLQMPEFDTCNITDVEDVECDVDLSRRRISVDNRMFQEQLDEMASCYSFTKDKNEAKEPRFQEREDNAITISLSDDRKCKNEKKQANLVGRNLFAPVTEEAGFTDMENIDSSTDQEDYQMNKNELYLDDTEEEDFQDNLIIDSRDTPEVSLPPTTRLLIIAEESKSLVPTVRILPLDENDIEGSDAETRSTDDESLNSNEEKEGNENIRILHSPQLPAFEGGSITVSENCIQSRHIVHNIEEAGTDIEYLDEENQKHMKGREYKSNSQYLVPRSVSSRMSDPREQDLTDNISGTSMLSLLYSDSEVFTDMENLESDEEEKKPRSNESDQNVRASNIDKSDVVFSTDDEITYSRAETATPHELKKELDQPNSIHVTTGNTFRIDYSEPEEVMYLKGGGFRELFSDAEEFQDDMKFQLNNVMEAWEYFNHTNDQDIASMNTEWCATKTDLIDVSTLEYKGTSQETQVSPSCQISSFPTISYESVLSRPENSVSQNESLQKVKSYAQIDAMLDKMLNEMDLLTSEDNCVNFLTLEPSSDALIEIPIKKLKKKKTYTTSVDIFVTEDMEEKEKLSGFERMDSQCNDSKKPEENQACASFNDAICSPYQYDVLFGDLNTLSNQTYDLQKDNDLVENFYEPIGYNPIYQIEDRDNIWWEGTYRNLSVVLEEDEENLSQTSSRPNALYTNIYELNDIDYGKHIVCGNELDYEHFADCGSDSSQIQSSISTDDSDNEISYNDNKANIKLLIKSKVGETNVVEIKSVKELMTKRTEQNLPPIVHENPRKLTKLAQKLSNIWDKRKHNYYFTMPSSNKEPKKLRNKPSFTLPRLFFRNSEVESFNDRISNGNSSKKRHNIIAKPSESFPLSFDHCATALSVERLKVDLYANIPFYPTYSCSIPSSSSSSRETQYLPPTDVTISEAYCDWSSEIYPLGKATSPQYLDKLEEKLLAKTVDTCVVRFPNNETTEVYDFNKTLNETNAFLQSESEAEPYDVWTERLFKDLKSDFDSIPNASPKNKTIKKGIFKTLKSFITRSTESLDLEGDRSSPKNEKIIKTKTNLDVFTAPSRSENNGDLFENKCEKSSKSVENIRNNNEKPTIQSEIIMSIPKKEAIRSQEAIKEEFITSQPQNAEKNITEESTDYSSKTHEQNEVVPLLHEPINQPNETSIINKEDKIRKLYSTADHIHEGDIENNSGTITDTLNRSCKNEDESKNLEQPKIENEEIIGADSSQISTPKKSGFWSFFTKKSKKNITGEDEKRPVICFEQLVVTKSFLQQEKENYDFVSQRNEVKSQENGPIAENMKILQNASVEKVDTPKSFLSKLKLTDNSASVMEPSYIKFDEDGLSYEPVNIVHEKQKKVTFEEGSYKDVVILGKDDEKNPPSAEKLICQLKSINSDVHTSNKGFPAESDSFDCSSFLSPKNEVDLSIMKGEITEDDRLPRRTLNEETVCTKKDVVSVTNTFLEAEKRLYDTELEIPMIVSGQTMRLEQKPLNIAPLESRKRPRMSGNDSSLDESRTDLLSECNGNKLLDRSDNAEQAFSEINKESNNSKNVIEPSNEQKIVHISDSELRILTDAFLKSETIGYHDEENKLTTDSSSNDKISSKHAKDSRNKKFFGLFGRKKQFSDKNLISKETEKYKNDSLQSFSLTQTKHIKELEGRESVMTSKEIESVKIGDMEEKNFSEESNSKKKGIFKIFVKKENDADTPSAKSKNKMDMSDYDSTSLTSDLTELTNKFLQNEILMSNRGNFLPYRLEKKSDIQQENMSYKKVQSGLDSEVELFPKMIMNKLQESNIPEALVDTTKNRDEDFVSYSKRKSRHGAYRENETQIEYFSNYVSATSDFLATEKKFNHYVVRKPPHIVCETEYIHEIADKNTFSKCPVEQSTLEDEEKSENNNEELSKVQVSFFKTETEIPIENNMSTEAYNSKSSSRNTSPLIENEKKPHEDNHIQSTEFFLLTEHTLYDGSTDYVMCRKNMKEQIQMTQNSTILNKNGNYNGKNSLEVSDGVRKVKQKTLKIGLKTHEQSIENDEANAIPTKTVLEDEIFQLSIQEKIRSTLDFLTMEKDDHMKQNMLDETAGSQNSTHNEDADEIGMCKQSNQKNNLSDTKSKRFLKIFKKKSQSKSEKLEPESEDIGVINLIPTLHEKPLLEKKTKESQIMCKKLGNISYENKSLNSRDKDSKTKGIFKIFSKKSEEKKERTEDSQDEIKDSTREDAEDEDQIDFEENNRNLQTDKALTLSSDVSKNIETSPFTNYKEISEATDYFLMTEKRLNCDIERKEFINEPANQTDFGDIVVDAPEVVIKQGILQEKKTKKKKFFKIFHRKSEEKENFSHTKVQESSGESQSRRDEENVNNEEKYCDSRDRDNIVGKIFRSSKERNVGAQKQESNYQDYTLEPIGITNEFLHKEKKFYLDHSFTDPIDHDLRIDQIHSSITRFTESDEEKRRCEKHEKKSEFKNIETSEENIIEKDNLSEKTAPPDTATEVKHVIFPIHSVTFEEKLHGSSGNNQFPEYSKPISDNTRTLEQSKEIELGRVIVPNTNEIYSESEIRSELLVKKGNKKDIYEDESNNATIQKKLISDSERNKKYSVRLAKVQVENIHSFPDKSKEGEENGSTQIESEITFDVLKECDSVDYMKTDISSAIQEDQKFSDNKQESPKNKLKSTTLPKDSAVKDGNKGFLKFFSRKKTSEEKTGDSTEILQKEDEKLPPRNLEACRLFLEREVEMYFDVSPLLESTPHSSISSKVLSEEKGLSKLTDAQQTVRRLPKKTSFFTFLKKKSKSDNENVENVFDEIKQSNHIFDSASFIREEIENYHDIFPSKKKKIPLEENIQEIRDSGSILSGENTNNISDGDYTAFDFIKEEVDHFENSKLRPTDTIDSSFRVETEVEQVDGDAPKQIITKKILITEKLIEIPGESNLTKITTNTILDALGDINKSSRDTVEQDNVNQQIFELPSGEHSDISDVKGIQNNFLSDIVQTHPEFTDIIPSHVKSKSQENLEGVEEEFVQKMKDLELARGDVIEDVSPLEKKIETFSNDIEEKITDLDESVPDDSKDLETAGLLINPELKSIMYSTGEAIEDRVGTSHYEVYEKKLESLNNFNSTAREHKISVTKLCDKENQVTEIPESIQVTENFVKELEVQYHTDKSLLPRNKNIASISSDDIKPQILDEKAQTTIENEYNYSCSKDAHNFENLILSASIMKENLPFVSPNELTQAMHPHIFCDKPEEMQENVHEVDDDCSAIESSNHKSLSSDVTCTDYSKRKPLFRIESDDDDLTVSTRAKDMANENFKLSGLMRKNSPDSEQGGTEPIFDNTFGKDSKSDVQIIEDKLRDLGKALDALEKLSEIKSDGEDKLKEKKLRRVERKFERMTSEALESTTDTDQGLKTFNPAENERYQQLVSQLSTDEVISFQNEYNNLWDEYTFSKSDEWDSKTPESQADVLELPQDTFKQLTETSHKPSTNTQTPQPKPRHQKLKDNIEETIHESEQHTKQISPVRDDLLDENDKTDEITYSEKKKFWENISKSPAKNQSDVAFKKRKSIGETSSVPIPKPRAGIQFSYSLAVTDNEKSSLMEHTQESIPTSGTTGMTIEEFLEYDTQLCELSQQQKLDTENKDAMISISETITDKPEDDPEYFLNESRTLREEEMLGQTEVSKRSLADENIVIPDEPIDTKTEKLERSDSDSEGSGQNSSQEGDNAGYISDSGDVEHYISDSEIEDRVPQIRERQMSVFVAPSVSQRTRYERSASLPTEDLYEVSARNTKLRKLYYEEQIKKEMIKEQLTIDLEDDISPERKSIGSSSNIFESNEEIIIEQPNDPNYSNDRKLNDYVEKTEKMDETSLKYVDSNLKGEYPGNVVDIPTSKDNESSLFEEQIGKKYMKETVSISENEEKESGQTECGNEEESMEIHVDKSETEKSEKASDHFTEKSVDMKSLLLDQLEGKLISSLIQDEVSANSIATEQPIITVTLSGIQKRISEEDDPYAPSVDSRMTDISSHQEEEADTLNQMQKDYIVENELSGTNADQSIHYSEENCLVQGDGQQVNENDQINISKQDQSRETIVNQPEENIESTIWEVSVESEVLTEEKLTTLPSIPIAVQHSSVDGKFASSSDKLADREDDSRGAFRNESNLGSEIHQDVSDSYASDRIKSESHSDMRKIILESLYQQKVDPEEARKIANSLIAEIESEIEKTESISEELRARGHSLDTENQQVTNYLKELADVKGLDQREVELVESILERRQQQISKLTRGDTQTSSMEITDEDLRYSEGDMDYSHLLEQQIDQLKAEYSDNLKTEYDTLVKDQNVVSRKVNRLSNQTVEEKYCSGDNQGDSMASEGKQTNIIEVSMDDETYSHMKNVILEEDENISETIIEDINESGSNLREEVKTNIHIENDESPSEEYNEKSLNTNAKVGSSAMKKGIISVSPETVGDISESAQLCGSSMKSIGKENMDKEIMNKDTNSEKIIDSREYPRGLIIATQKIPNSIQVQQMNDDNVSTEHFQPDEQTRSTKYENDMVQKSLSPEIEQPEKDTSLDHKIKRTSSSDSKSSGGSVKSPDLISSSSCDKKVDENVVFRQPISEKESKQSRKSGNELESYSSSGESYYHSFEIDSKSRPCSSDVEGILPTGSSEYESALNSQELSARSQVTSGEYHTAISSLSSKDSMKSFESESSGNLASIEISEMSETLVPSNSDLEGDVDLIVDPIILDECELLWPTNNEITEANLEQEKVSNEYIDNFSTNLEPDSDQSVEIPSKMKRSYEMTFQPEPKIFTEDSPHAESNDTEERFGTSLDEGSVLSVSLSSTSSAQLKTVIEISRNESGGFEESLTASVLSDQASIEEYDSVFRSIDANSQTHSTNSTIDSSHESVEVIPTRTEKSTENVHADLQKYSHDELRKKGHRRHESSSFIPSLIHGISKSSECQSAMEASGSAKENEQNKNEIELLTHSAEETKEQSLDLSIKKEITERRDSHGKSSTTSSEKSSFEEAEAEAAFSMVAHISPVHKIKQICPIIEDIDAEKCELEAKERAEREKECRTSQAKDASPGSIPDIKVTEHMAPLDESNFRYPELEMERKELEKETQKIAESETPVSISSKSSEETDQGQVYVLEERNIILEENDVFEDKVHSESKSEISTVVEKPTVDERTTDSPNSDSFELVEKPDIIDDFVVIEEVAKEANEMDSEGKSVKIQSKPKRPTKHDEDIDAYLAKSDPTPLTKMTELKYFPDNSNDELEFEFEESPPQKKFGIEKSKDYGLEYDKELEANRKWIEQQFHGDQAAMAAAGYGYEMEFERGPLEDIKEEDINDFDLASSRIGSLGSQKESGGSLTSVKDSYSSTPDYDVLAGRKYFTKSGEHDDISMSSLQEFENLERAMSLETKKFHHGSGSQDSSSNGSFRTRYYANKAQGDDISVSSLKEFEGLERACIAAHKTEIKVKEEEELLSQIDKGLENVILDTEKQEQKNIHVVEKKVGELEEADYEKRIFEMNEIIKQAQNNVERFIDLKETEKTESLGRGDSIEEVSKVPDLDLDAPLAKSKSKLEWEEDDPMMVSTDSLDMNQQKPVHYDSTDSLDQKNNDCDVMTASTDSIELNNKMSKDNVTADSMERGVEKCQMVGSDSLEIAVVTTARLQEDSLEEDEQKICYDYSSSDTGKDFSSSVKEDVGEHDEHLHELMLGSTDSLEPTSSAATHATYQYESDSVFSGSFTSGGSNTMVSSTDTIDPTLSRESIDLAAAARKVWFDENLSEKKTTSEYLGESSKPYVTEVIEPSDDPCFSHTIHRLVQLPAEVRKVVFRGEDAEQQLQRFINDFDEGEEVQETENIDVSGNIHVKRVVQKRYIIKPDNIESSSSIITYQKALDNKEAPDYEGTKTTEMAFSQLTALTKSLTGDEPIQPSDSPDTSTFRAQAPRRRPLRYDISIEDQTEVDPREHDWRFDLNKYEQTQDSSTEKRGSEVRPQAFDQQQLSQEMKELLEEMEKTSKQ